MVILGGWVFLMIEVPLQGSCKKMKDKSLALRGAFCAIALARFAIIHACA